MKQNNKMEYIDAYVMQKKKNIKNLIIKIKKDIENKTNKTNVGMNV